MHTNTTADAKPHSVEQALADYLDHEPSPEAKAAREAARELFRRELGQRFKDARGKMEVADAAARIGVHRNTLWNIERGDSLPDAFEIEVFARVYGTSVAALMGHESGGARMPGAPEKSLRAIELDDFIYVPHFDMHVSAGPGAFQELEHVVAMRPFEAGYIRVELGIAHNELALCGVVGTSALPHLKPKDTIMVDLRDRQVMNEGMHILRLDDALMLKHVQRLPGKVLRVSSSNDEYKAFDIATTDESQRDFEIIGRVRWGGVTFF